MPPGRAFGRPRDGSSPSPSPTTAGQSFDARKRRRRTRVRMVAMATSSSLVNDMVLLRKEVSKGCVGEGRLAAVRGEEKSEMRSDQSAIRQTIGQRRDRKGAHWGGCCEEKDTYEYRRKRVEREKGGGGEGVGGGNELTLKRASVSASRERARRNYL